MLLAFRRDTQHQIELCFQLPDARAFERRKIPRHSFAPARIAYASPNAIPFIAWVSFDEQLRREDFFSLALDLVMNVPASGQDRAPV